MMFMPISTVMALHANDGSHCHGEPRSPWMHQDLEQAGPLGAAVDAISNGGNDNGFVCFNGRSNMFQDDVLPRR